MAKAKLITPRQYATEQGIPYRTVMEWLQRGLIAAAEKSETPTGHYWMVPGNAPKPELQVGRPKKEAVATPVAKKAKGK